MKTRKRSVATQCSMVRLLMWYCGLYHTVCILQMLSRQRKRTCGMQTEGLIALETLTCSYIGKQKEPTAVSITVPRSTVSHQPEEVPGELLSVDDGLSMLEPCVSSSKSVTTVHNWLATEDTDACARCIMVNPKSTSSVCARSRPCDTTLQPTLGNPLRQPPTCGILKALWKLQLVLSKLPVDHCFVDKLVLLMASFVDCTSSVFKGEVEPKLSEPVLQMLEQCGKVPGLATYMLGQKLQELCNALQRLRKLHRHLTPEFSSSIDALYMQALGTLDLVVCPQQSTPAKDDDPAHLDVGSASCSIVSSPVGSDMESDSSADDMDFSNESSESVSSDSESCTPQSSARTTARAHLGVTTNCVNSSHKGGNSCATPRSTVGAEESSCSLPNSTDNGDKAAIPTAGNLPSSSSTGIQQQVLGSRQTVSDSILGNQQPIVSSSTRSEPICAGAVVQLTHNKDTLTAIQQSTALLSSLPAPGSQSVSLPLLSSADTDKINTVLQQLCRQLYERLITGKGVAFNAAPPPSSAQLPKTITPPPSSAQLPKTITAKHLSAQSSMTQSPSNPCKQRSDIPSVLPVTVTTSVVTNLAPTSATPGVKTSVCTPPFSGVKVTLCSTNSTYCIASAVSVLSRAVGSQSAVPLPKTVSDAVNEIFSKKPPPSTSKHLQIKGGAAPLLSVAKPTTKSLPQGQSQVACIESGKNPPATTFQTIRIATPKPGNTFYPLQPATTSGTSLPLENRSPAPVKSPTTVSELFLIPLQMLPVTNSCKESQENNSTQPALTVNTSNISSSENSNLMPVASITDNSKAGDTSKILSKTISTANECQKNSSLMPVSTAVDQSKTGDTCNIPAKCQPNSSVMLVSEHSKTGDTSTVLSTTEKCQQNSSLVLMSTALEDSKTGDTSKVSCETLSTAEKCQQNSSLAPVSTALEHLKTGDTSKVSSEILSTAEKCQQNSSLAPVSTALEHLKTGDTSKILSKTISTANECQKNSSLMPVSTAVDQSKTGDTCNIPAKCQPNSSVMLVSEHSKTGDTSTVLSTTEKCQQNSSLVLLSTALEDSKTADTSKVSSEILSTAEKCQQNSSLAPVSTALEHSKPGDTSKVSSETLSTAEKCQQNSSVAPVPTALEHSKPGDTSKVSCETLSTAEKCQQNSSLAPVSTALEHSKPGDTSNILSHQQSSSLLPVLSIAEHSRTSDTPNIFQSECQPNSNLTPVPTPVDHSKTGDTSDILSQIPSKYEQNSSLMPVSSAVGYSKDFNSAHELAQMPSFAEGCQHNSNSTSVVGVPQDNTSTSVKIPSKTSHTIITLPLAAPLINPNIANSYLKTPRGLPSTSFLPNAQQKTSAVPQKASFDISLAQVPSSQEGPSSSSCAPVLSNPLPASNANTCHEPSVVTKEDFFVSQLSKPSPFATPSNLKLFATVMPEGIVIKWTFVEEFLSYESQVMNYELYVRVGKEQVPSKAISWVLLGKILPLPLPMAVTLTNFVQGECYTFFVKAVFVNRVRFIYSNTGKVQL